MHKIASVALGVALAATALAAGCSAEDLEQLVSGASADESAPTPTSAAAASAVPVADGGTITVASFNIQVFGESKLGSAHVMDVLVRVVRSFDVVAVQEVRAANQDVVPRFVGLINADGSRYAHVLGPRLGRTSSKEQYAFLYNTDRLELDESSVYTVNDPEDLLHREPLVARFRVRGPPAAEAFTFTLVNIHTDPDETDTELDALDDVFRAVQRDPSGEDDVILLGDLNVDEHHLGELGEMSGVAWALSGVPTNTRGTEQYDNIVLDRDATSEFTGAAGVYDLMSQFGLSREEALEVSDHLPIWAEFSVCERQRAAPLAGRPGAAPR